MIIAVARIVLKKNRFRLYHGTSQKEMQIPKIQGMSPDIYKKIAQILKELSTQKYEHLELDVHNELIRLLILSTKSLIELRTRKLLEITTANLCLTLHYLLMNILI